MEHEKDKGEENEILDNKTGAQTEVADGQSSGDQIGQRGPAEIEKMTAELSEAKDKYLRLYADFENFRRRTAKEKTEYLTSAQAELLKALLPILDDFERAQKAMATAQDVNAVREGVNLIYNKLFKTLEQKGLKPMEAVGQHFDADLHESIAQIPAPQEALKGKVMDEIEKGYYLQDKVLRFAKVIVGA